jgi:uncharacterized protein (DUF849 family)
MSRPVIISCAITGAMPGKADNPALPISPAEQIESIHEAFEAGASMVHLHVRDAEGRPTNDPERFAAVMEGARRHCPGLIIQLSTMGTSEDPKERGAALSLRPDMATLVPGSVNYFDRILKNSPAMIESLADMMAQYGVTPEFAIFDMAMLYNAKGLVHAGLVREPLHVQLLLGIPGGLPALRHLLDTLVAELHDLSPDASWVATGIGRHQETVMEWALYRGGHLRTGLGNNVRLSPKVLAPSNAELVRRAASHCISVGAFVATPTQARSLLGLRPANQAAAPAAESRTIPPADIL